jgi:hypothetical protein
MCHRCDDSNQEQHVHAVPSRRDALIAGAALVAAPFLRGVTSTVQAAQAANTGVPVGRPGAGGAGPWHGDGMGELRRRQGQFEVLATRSDRQRQFRSREGRVDMALSR